MMLFRTTQKKLRITPVYTLLGSRLQLVRKATGGTLEFYRVSLAKVEGLHTPAKFIILTIIGCTLEKQDKHEEAKAIHRQALEVRGRVLGEEHRDTL
jgi:hypothetical protein